VNTARRLAIGTVQFGLDYGISNDRGKVPREIAGRILRDAAAAGISTVDTAAAYGEAETVLAALLSDLPGFHVVTKTLSATNGVSAVIERARLSSDRFGPSCALLLHSAADLRMSEGADLWRALTQLRDDGRFARIGISAYASDDPVDLARRFRPDIMQLPVSVLDQRLVQSGALETLKSLAVEIHVRSVFVQGAIFLDPDALPPVLAHARAVLAGFRENLDRRNLAPLQAAIGYPLSIPAIDRVVVGVTSAEELAGIVSAANAAKQDVPWQEFAVDDDVLLDPRKWQTT
jgi:aryl-alcohol dehydrogenase-like predicted oxidoreductase